MALRGGIFEARGHSLDKPDLELWCEKGSPELLTLWFRSRDYEFRLTLRADSWHPDVGSSSILKLALVKSLLGITKSEYPSLE